MRWTKKKLEREALRLKARSKEDVVVRGVRRGRPLKPKTIKTNLDLSEELARELDLVAEFMGSTRQGIVKGFILSGLKDFYLIRAAKSMPRKFND